MPRARTHGAWGSRWSRLTTALCSRPRSTHAHCSWLRSATPSASRSKCRADHTAGARFDAWRSSKTDGASTPAGLTALAYSVTGTTPVSEAEEIRVMRSGQHWPGLDSRGGTTPQARTWQLPGPVSAHLASRMTGWLAQAASRRCVAPGTRAGATYRRLTDRRRLLWRVLRAPDLGRVRRGETRAVHIRYVRHSAGLNPSTATDDIDEASVRDVDPTHAVPGEVRTQAVHRADRAVCIG